MLCAKAVDEQSDDIGQCSGEGSGIYGHGSRVITLHADHRSRCGYDGGIPKSWSVDRLPGAGWDLDGLTIKLGCQACMRDDRSGELACKASLHF